MEKKFIIQASSKTWAGGPDFQMNLIENQPVVYHTISKIFNAYPDAAVITVAPEFDRDGDLEFLKEDFSTFNFKLFYGYSDNPLQRILSVTNEWDMDEFFIRIDGLNMFFDIHKSIFMLEEAKKNNYDLYMFPHDYPVQFTSEVYKIRALRKAFDEISSGQTLKKYFIHPKYYLHHNENYISGILTSLPEYSDDYLKKCRNIASDIYNIERLYTDNKYSVEHADQLAYHYHVANNFLTSEMDVLDIACGDGNGAEIIAKQAKSVVGADIDQELISELTRKNQTENIKYICTDALKMDFETEQFDAVCSMETIEHLDEVLLLSEIHRVLKPGGILILSTPQNAMGHIPINAEHRREFSLKELTDLVKKKFEIKEVIGLKAGTISFKGDPIGRSTIIICKK